jgi:outer membrane protein TolC
LKRLLLLYAPLIAFSQDYDFETLLQNGLKNSENLKSKELSIEIAKRDIALSKSMDYGKINIDATISHTNQAMYAFGNKLSSRTASFDDFGAGEFNPNNLGVEPNNLNNPSGVTNFDIFVNYEYPIFTGYKISKYKDISILNRLANEIRFSKDKKEYKKELLNSYNGVVASKYYIEALKKAKISTGEFVKISKNLLEAGIVVKSDVLQAQSYEANINSKLIDAKNRYTIGIEYLKFLTGLKDISDVKTFMNIDINRNNRDSIITKAIDSRDDLKEMKVNLSIMQKKIGLEESDRYPQVGLQVKYGFNDSNIIPKLTKDYYLIGVNAKYTIFDNDANSQKIQKAIIEYNQLLHRYNYAVDGAKLDISKELLTIESKEEIIKERQKSKELNQEVLETTKLMYQNGLENMATLLSKQSEVERANAELISSEYDLLTSISNLKFLIGE